MRSGFRPVAYVLITSAGLLGTTCLSVAQTATATNSYTAFVTALAAMGASADDLITNQRNAARQIYMRQLVTGKVLAAFPSTGSSPPAKPLTLGDVDPTTLLCKFRSANQIIVKSISTRDSTASITIDQLATIAQQNYLSGTVRQLTAAATPDDTSTLLSALKVIFAPPPAAAPVSPGSLSVSDANRNSVEKSCEQDLTEFEEAYYGQSIPAVVVPGPLAAPAASPAPLTIPDLSVFGPIGAAISTAISIITPVIEGFAAIEASSEAATKVKSILQNDQQALTAGGLGLGRTVSDYLFAKRLSLAGQFAEQMAVIQNDSIDLTSKEVQAACQTPAMYQREKGLLNGAFMRCYSLIWTHFEKEITTALQTAQAYDQVADAGDTSTALDKFKSMTSASSYAKIVANGFSQTDNFWQQVTQIVAFAGAVVTATSPANVKKLEQAFQTAAKSP